MLVVNAQNLLSLFVLFSLIQGIRPDYENISEEVLYFTETIVDDTSIISANTVEDDDQNFDDVFFTTDVEVSSTTEKEEDQTNTPEPRVPRKSRDVYNGSSPYGMECFACFGNTSSKSDDNCYEGMSMPTKKCADAEHCYIEINPKFIKRGCILPGRVNRTFVCKCPLCNDKPSFDTQHYDYKKISDWEYDNARLQTPLYAMDLMCKVCETKGTNPTSDKNCRYGKNADYMVCANNQLCYTNIDDEIDFVSRGCIDKPIFNSIFFFCNNTECNSDKFPNPSEKLKLRSNDIKLKDDPARRKRRPVVVSSSHNLFTYNLYLILTIILKSIKCI